MNGVYIESRIIDEDRLRQVLRTFIEAPRNKGYIPVLENSMANGDEIPEGFDRVTLMGTRQSVRQAWALDTVVPKVRRH